MRAPISNIMLIAAACGLLLIGCQPKPEASAAPVAPTPTPTPTTTMPEETVSTPEADTTPSVEVTEELPEDIAELNRRGYLKDIFFATDEYTLDADARQKLAENARWLKEHPSIQVLLEGHADERNTREYNLALGDRRASAAADYLVSLGVDRARLRTVSYGEERPFASGHDEPSWQLNRRVHFVITGR